MTLEERVQRLEDTEAIKCLMGKYFRCLDTHNWEGLKEVFDIDAQSEYCDGYMVYEGREDVVGFLESCMLPEQISQHMGHTPEIQLVDATHAIAGWYLEDILINLLSSTNQRGTAHYTIKYIKRDDGQWYINFIGYKRVYEELWPRNEYSAGHIGNLTFYKESGIDVDELLKKNKQQ